MDRDWYWEKGLHDAEVLDIKKINFEYDYTQRKPRRNMLEIILDTRSLYLIILLNRYVSIIIKL